MDSSLSIQQLFAVPLLSVLDVSGQARQKLYSQILLCQRNIDYH